MHAYRTAIQFRQEWDAYSDDTNFDKYKTWRKVRLYDPEYPKFDLKRRRRRKGEKLPEEEQLPDGQVDIASGKSK